MPFRKQIVVLVDPAAKSYCIENRYNQIIIQLFHQKIQSTVIAWKIDTSNFHASTNFKFKILIRCIHQIVTIFQFEMNIYKQIFFNCHKIMNYDGYSNEEIAHENCLETRRLFEDKYEKTAPPV